MIFFILLALFALLFGLGLFVCESEVSVVLMVTGFFGGLFTLLVSFLTSIGPDLVMPVQPLIERTPYRLIVSLPNDRYRMEHTYMDAFTIAQPNPHFVLVIPHNAWGIELTSQRHLELAP